MPTSFRIETTRFLAQTRLRVRAASTLAEACRVAVTDADWSGATIHDDGAGETHVTGIWRLPAGIGGADPVAIPSHFHEAIARRSRHFDALTAVLAEVAQPMGLSEWDFRRWLPRAQAVIAKARAIEQGARDPD